MITDKPEKLNIKEIWLDGRKLKDDEYQEIIFWDIREERWSSNSYFIIPKPFNKA